MTIQDKTDSHQAKFEALRQLVTVLKAECPQGLIVQYDKDKVIFIFDEETKHSSQLVVYDPPPPKHAIP